MTIPQIDTFHLVVGGIVLAIALMIPFTRAVLTWLFGVLWDVGVKIGGMLFALVHEAGAKLWEAHKCWIMNWRPRQMVIPSLRRERSTRRNR